MSKVLLGVIGVLILVSSFLYMQNKNLVSINQAYELRDAEQKKAIESLEKDFALQTQGLIDLQSKTQEIQNEMNRYLDIFKRHNLSKLAAAKPGLIEPRVNKATKEVFDGIEQDSRSIDNLDDGLQLQPNSN
jgi:hypothetical protein